MSKLLAARVHPWQAFRFKRYAEESGRFLGDVLTDAIKCYLAEQNIPEEKMNRWLEEYHKTTSE